MVSYQIKQEWIHLNQDSFLLPSTTLGWLTSMRDFAVWLSQPNLDPHQLMGTERNKCLTDHHGSSTYRSIDS